MAGACRVHPRAALLNHLPASAESQGTKRSCMVAFVQAMEAMDATEVMPVIPAPLPPCESHCIPCEAAKRTAHCAARSE